VQNGPGRSRERSRTRTPVSGGALSFEGAIAYAESEKSFCSLVASIGSPVTRSLPWK
jgi:hypothetical protein